MSDALVAEFTVAVPLADPVAKLFDSVNAPDPINALVPAAPLATLPVA